jgi:hypothetical protein
MSHTSCRNCAVRLEIWVVLHLETEALPKYVVAARTFKLLL